MRLGFLLAAPEVADEARRRLGPWAVSGAAVAIGRAAYADTGWLEATARRLAKEADRLDERLRAAGFTLLGGTTLFRLAHHPAAGDWFRRLAGAGIWTRPFPAEPHWLRFGLPATEADWQRLDRALAG